MRRSFITSALIASALLASALASGLILLLLLLTGADWGDAARLSATETPLLIGVALVAFLLNRRLAPVLAISVWTGGRGMRRLGARLAPLRQTPRPHRPSAPTRIEPLESGSPTSSG